MKLKRKHIAHFIVVVVIFLLLPMQLFAQNQEHIVKAAYLEKIANYITWPVDENREIDDIFTVLVVADKELCRTIEHAFNSRKLKGEKANVVCSEQVTELRDIDLMILMSQRTKDLDNAMQLCKKDRFLLITDAEGFAHKGAHVNFFITERQTLHFEMNKESLDADGFKVDFLLLEFAKVVKN